MTNACSQRRISTRSLRLSPSTQVRLTTGRIGPARKRRSTLLLQMAGAAFGDGATNAGLMRICPVQTSCVATEKILMGEIGVGTNTHLLSRSSGYSVDLRALAVQRRPQRGPRSLGADLEAPFTAHLQRLGESPGCCKVARSQRCHDLRHRTISVYIARPLRHQCVRPLGTGSVAIMYRHEEFFYALLTSMPIGVLGMVRRCADRLRSHDAVLCKESKNGSYRLVHRLLM